MKRNISATIVADVKRFGQQIKRMTFFSAHTPLVGAQQERFQVCNAENFVNKIASTPKADRTFGP
jgi:hypothetical protein